MPRALTAVVAGLVVATGASAQHIDCHVSFAGASRTFTIAPSPHTAAPEPVLEGASFVWAVANRIPPSPGGGVQITTYVLQQQQQVPLHQATFQIQANQRVHGFTGLQVVREPQRGLELSYWCERAP